MMFDLQVKNILCCLEYFNDGVPEDDNDNDDAACCLHRRRKIGFLCLILYLEQKTALSPYTLDQCVNSKDYIL